MATICGFCSGSGRDPVTPAKGPCPVCGGLGLDYSTSPPAPGGPRRVSSGGGGGTLLLGLVLLVCLVAVGAGYVVASEMVAHHWFGARYAEHSWTNVALYTGGSIAAVALTARLWGFLPGAVVGFIPTMPLYHATKGGVGFWFIALNGPEDPMDNVFTSWIAFLGMAGLHLLIAWAVQPQNDSPMQKMVRLGWVRSPLGLTATAAMAGAAYLAYSAIGEAVAAF